VARSSSGGVAIPGRSLMSMNILLFLLVVTHLLLYYRSLDGTSTLPTTLSINLPSGPQNENTPHVVYYKPRVV